MASRFRDVLLRKFSVVAVLAVALSTLSLTVSDRPALADYKQQIADAQAQLAQLQDQAEQVAERYNAARIAYAGAQRDVSAAHQRVSKAQQQIGDLQRSVSAFAAATSRGGGLAQVQAVTDSNPQEFLDKVSGLEAVAHGQQQTFQQLAVARHSQEVAEQAAERALARQQKVTNQIDADRRAVEHNVAQQQSILRDLKAKQAELERQARIRAQRAREAAERAAAQRAAEQAAAQQALLAQQEQATAAAGQAFAGQGYQAPSAPVSGSGGAATAVQVAYAQLGKPYVWGAEGPNSFDCSGLTKYAWARAGVYLDHYTGSQWNEGAHVSRSQLEPGDLVFFGSDLHHVGIYIGNNQFIHAPHTGDVVKISSLTGYYANEYAGAVRPGV